MAKLIQFYQTDIERFNATYKNCVMRDDAIQFIQNILQKSENVNSQIFNDLVDAMCQLQSLTIYYNIDIFEHNGEEKTENEEMVERLQNAAMELKNLVRENGGSDDLANYLFDFVTEESIRIIVEFVQTVSSQ